LSTVKVKITKSISGVRYDFTQGQEAEIDEAIARELIEAGVAEAIEGSLKDETSKDETKATSAKKKK